MLGLCMRGFLNPEAAIDRAAAMADFDKQNSKAGSPRQDRLKLALRENLKRRKSQSRGRREDISNSKGDDALGHEGMREDES